MDKKTTIKKSIFANIVAFSGYIQVIYIFVVFLILGIIDFITNPSANAVVFSILSDIATAIVYINIVYFIFFPMLIISLTAGAIQECINAGTRGYIMQIPDKITSNKIYMVLFYSGIVVTFLTAFVLLYISCYIFFTPYTD